ncbi:MAG: hypothetical protein ABSG22_05525 [Sedimentisphaerales bacterium]
MKSITEHRHAICVIANEIYELVREQSTRERFASYLRKFCTLAKIQWEQDVAKEIAKDVPRKDAEKYLASPLCLRWFGYSGDVPTIRPPQNMELLCDYVLLAVIHDISLRPQANIPLFSEEYEGYDILKRERFIGGLASHYSTSLEPGCWRVDISDERISQLRRAIKHVQADLASTKQNGEKSKGATAKKRYRKPVIIAALITAVAMILAAVITSHGNKQGVSLHKNVSTSHKAETRGNLSPAVNTGPNSTVTINYLTPSQSETGSEINEMDVNRPK